MNKTIEDKIGLIVNEHPKTAGPVFTEYSGELKRDIDYMASAMQSLYMNFEDFKDLKKSEYQIEKLASMLFPEGFKTKSFDVQQTSPSDYLLAFQFEEDGRGIFFTNGIHLDKNLIKEHDYKLVDNRLGRNTSSAAEMQRKKVA